MTGRPFVNQSLSRVGDAGQVGEARRRADKRVGYVARFAPGRHALGAAPEMNLGIDLQVCPHCGCGVWILAEMLVHSIEDPIVIEKILDHVSSG